MPYDAHLVRDRVLELSGRKTANSVDLAERGRSGIPMLLRKPTPPIKEIKQLPPTRRAAACKF